MKKNVTIEIIIHLLFWILCFYFFVNNSFLRFNTNNVNEEYYSLILVFTSIYINNFILIPHLFSKSKYLLYFVGLSFLLLLISIIEFSYIKDVVLAKMSGVKIEIRRNVLQWNFFGIFFRDTLFVAFFTMFKIYRDAIKANKLLKRNAELEKQYFLSQMDTIKSKVNSHFFFNTLDSIYSLIITKSTKASETVLNLSDLMRYVVGESDKTWVSLEKEINFLRNYIELEKVKDSSTNLSFEITGNTTEYEVPPMIFESFVNNAIKYTNFRNDGFVSIKIICESGIIYFNCKNTINYHSDKNMKSTKKGINNTRNRLNMIYNHNYRLDIIEENGYYIVNLLLKKQSF